MATNFLWNWTITRRTIKYFKEYGTWQLVRRAAWNKFIRTDFTMLAEPIPQVELGLEALKVIDEVEFYQLL